MQVQQLYPANFFRFCLSSVDCLPATLQEKDQKTEAKIKDWLINVQSYSVVTAAIIVFFIIYIYIYMYYVLCIRYISKSDNDRFGMGLSD